MNSLENDILHIFYSFTIISKSRKKVQYVVKRYFDNYFIGSFRTAFLERIKKNPFVEETVRTTLLLYEFNRPNCVFSVKKS